MDVEGTGEVVALAVFAVEAADAFPLLGGFDALGRHVHPEIVGEGSDRADNFTAAIMNILNKGSVDFDRVDGKLVKVAERGIAGSEIVDDEFEVEALEPLKKINQRRAGFHQDALGDLKIQATAGKARLVQGLPDALNQIRLMELKRA